MSKSEKRIGESNTDSFRRSSVNAPQGNQHKSFDTAPIVRAESFGQQNPLEQPEVVEWQNHSFGDSEDHRIFESKRLIDIAAEASDNDNDAGNFSFCESDKKSQPNAKNSMIRDSNILPPQFIEKDANLFATPVTEEQQNIEKILRRPTAVFVPCYADACKLTSDT